MRVAPPLEGVKKVLGVNRHAEGFEQTTCRVVVVPHISFTTIKLVQQTGFQTSQGISTGILTLSQKICSRITSSSTAEA